MLNWMKRFRASEDGAVTVDWIVLTAGLAALGIALVTMIAEGATDSSKGLGARLSSQDVMEFN